MTQTPGVLRLKTVYGDFVHVRAADLAKYRHQIPICRPDGERLSDWLERRRVRRPGEVATTVARGNLAEGTLL